MGDDERTPAQLTALLRGDRTPDQVAALRAERELQMPRWVVGRPPEPAPPDEPYRPAPGDVATVIPDVPPDPDAARHRAELIAAFELPDERTP